MPDSPTIGELARLVDRLTDQVKALVDRLDREREEHQRTYLPREVWNAMHQADGAVIADLSTDIRGCKDATKAEINRVEAKVDKFNEEYDTDRKHDAEVKRQEQLAEKARRQQFTLAVVGLFVTSLVSIVIAVLAYVSR
jgi:hypothetical protein